MVPVLRKVTFNFDASPTLWLQRLPLVGLAAKAWVPPRFPRGARYGDIVKGLPVADSIAGLVYCSHVLGHLAQAELRQALAENELIVLAARPSYHP